MDIEKILPESCRRELRRSGVSRLLRTPRPDMTRPVMLIVETTNICNLDCVFCARQIQTRPIGTMTPAMFDRVVSDYLDIGGGAMSLTPMVGDALLDARLLERLERLAATDGRITASLTTNLLQLDEYSDSEVRQLLGGLTKLHVSMYGLDAEEFTAVTRRPAEHFDRIVGQLGRVASLVSQAPGGVDFYLGFRLLGEPDAGRIEGFIRDACGRPVQWFATNQYGNWGGRIERPLPGRARYVERRKNRLPCMLLLVSPQVYWDGRVSACHCCDYDADEELALGNLGDSTLLELYNSPGNESLWRRCCQDDLPKMCRACSLHRPVNAGGDLELMARDIALYIGG